MKAMSEATPERCLNILDYDARRLPHNRLERNILGNPT